MSASEIDFASTFSALVLGTQSQTSRRKGREHTMKYEVWVLEKRLVGENRWRQFFCDGRQEALDVAEGFIDIAEKIEVKPA